MFSRSFAPYHKQVRQLEKRFVSEDPEAIDGYIGAGAECLVYRLENNPEVVAKLPRRNAGKFLELVLDVQILRSRLIRGIGCAGLEQLVAYSNLLPSALLTEYASGQSLEALTQAGGIERVTKADYSRLLTTFQAMQQRGLSTDAGNPGNVLYTPGQGFTVIDYHTNNEFPQTLMGKVLDFAEKRMLLGDLDRGSEIPAYASAYRDTCGEVLGKTVAVTIDEYWTHQGFTPPA